MDKSTVVRILVFIFAWVNQFLVSKGMQPLPVLSEDFIAELITLFASIWTLWKNNYLSKKGLAQKDVLEQEGLK